MSKKKIYYITQKKKLFHASYICNFCNNLYFGNLLLKIGYVVRIFLLNTYFILTIASDRAPATSNVVRRALFNNPQHRATKKVA